MKVSALFYIYYMFNLKMYSIHLNSIHNSKSKKKKKKTVLLSLTQHPPNLWTIKVSLVKELDFMNLRTCL